MRAAKNVGNVLIGRAEGHWNKAEIAVWSRSGLERTRGVDGAKSELESSIFVGSNINPERGLVTGNKRSGRVGECCYEGNGQD